MKRKILSLALTAVMLMTLFSGLAVETCAASNDTGSLTVKAPDLEYVYFGTYPQTEIVSSASQCGTYGRDWAAAGDCEVNVALYSTLSGLSADKWDENNDCTVEGTKYRRMKAGDALETYSVSYYYNWSDDTTYHYFRYDPIKWRILKTTGSDAFLVSDVALDYRCYHSAYAAVTWETCEMRSWLGSTFLNTAFTPGEQNAIKKTTLVNDDNDVKYKGIGTGGADTEDKVFLLSLSEVSGTGGQANGFAAEATAEDTARTFKSSTYAKARGIGAYGSDDKTSKSNCNVMLRTPGCDNKRHLNIGISGSIMLEGYINYSIGSGICPALHLNLDVSGVYTYEYKDVDAVKPAQVTLSPSSFTYDGTAKTPAVSIEGLVMDRDYTVSYSENVDAGTGLVEITGMGDYAGTISKSFSISCADISGRTVQIGSAVYSGKKLTPEVQVEGLTASDYALSYRNNINAGWATVTITGKGNYKGTITEQFQIQQLDINTIGLASGYTSSKVYTGNKIYPTVNLNGGLKNGTDFTVSGGKAVGKYKIRISGTGNYTGVIEKEFTILPKKASVSKLTPGKARLTVVLGSKVSATGGSKYQVQYKVKGAKSWKSKYTSGKTLTIKSLKKGKKYQVRVRACRKVGGKTYYGNWSAIKTSGKIK